jgi:O-antigen ligase
MELGILLIIVLGALQGLSSSRRKSDSSLHSVIRHAPRGVHGSPEPHWIQGQSPEPHPANGGIRGALRIPHSAFILLLFSLFLALVLFQMIPLPAGLLKIISPKTNQLHFELSALPFEPSSSSFELSALSFNLSFFPFATEIEFIKWLSLGLLFFFLLHWRPFLEERRMIYQLMIAILLVGIGESLYGMFEYFSGHQHILFLEGSALMSSVTGTYINRNYFAGYLLLVIPMSIGFFFSRPFHQHVHSISGTIPLIVPSLSKDWRTWLSSLDGKSLLLGFGIILMILGLLFSASRMGIISLLLSFTLISLLFRDTRNDRRVSAKSVLILGLALLWAAWIGLDAVINRFFSASEDFKIRWEIWRNTYQILKDFPLFGSGLGTFVQVFPMYRSFHLQGLVTHAENDFLQLAAEVGLVGVGILVLLFGFLFIKSASAIRRLSSNDPEKYVGIGGLVGILALMFHSLVERNIQVPSNAFLFTLLWAMVLRTSAKR